MTRQAVENIEPICIECGGIGELVGAAVIYPHRPDLEGKLFYRCACGAYVRCHDGTEIPLGFPAGPKTREARGRAHRAFDPLWEAKKRRDKCSKGKARAAGYKWLADQLGIRVAACHISHFDAATCERVVAICRAIRS